MRSTPPAHRHRLQRATPATGTSRRGRRHRRERRIPGTTLVVIATIGGLAMALRYHPAITSHPGQGAAAIEAGSIGTHRIPAGGAVRPTTRASVGRSDVTVLGRVITTDYGDLQVQVTLQKGKIISARAVRIPEVGGRQGERINARALPILYAETTQTQSAHIDAVSGATISSGAYRQSLQSAIDAAHRT